MNRITQVPRSNTNLPSVSATLGELKVEVKHTRCIGAAVCVKNALASFVLNNQRRSVPTDLSANDLETFENTARLCPSQAIYIFKKGKQLWPRESGTGKQKQPGPKHKMRLDVVD